MAKVVFVQSLFLPMLGVMNISAVAKKAGHECGVVLGAKKDLLRKLVFEEPDLVAFSCLSNEKKWLEVLAGEIKKNIGSDLPIIVGGPLATFSPEIIQNRDIDIICRGEGEYPMVELLDRIDRKTSFSDIKNLWIKKENIVFQNEIRPLIEDLDVLPFPDRQIYKGYKFIHNCPYAPVLTARGCPYECNYCNNHVYKELYKGKGKYVRRRSVDNVIAECVILKERYRPKRIFFCDDIFLADKQWLSDFLTRYKEKVCIPFHCSARIGLFDEEIVKMVASSGCCYSVGFGVESGNSRYRINVLKKDITEAEIISGADLLKKYKLKRCTLNMLGLPGERLEDAWNTIKLNVKIKPELSVCTMYLPMPGTKLAEFALKEKYISRSDFESLTLFNHGRSVMKQKEIKEIVNLHKFFYILIYFPQLSGIIRILLKLPLNIFYEYMYKLFYLFCFYRKLMGLNFSRAITEGVVAFRYYRYRW